MNKYYAKIFNSKIKIKMWRFDEKQIFINLTGE
jgi:hypothetical protein